MPNGNLPLEMSAGGVKYWIVAAKDRRDETVGVSVLHELPDKVLNEVADVMYSDEVGDLAVRRFESTVSEQVVERAMVEARKVVEPMK